MGIRSAPVDVPTTAGPISTCPAAMILALLTRRHAVTRLAARAAGMRFTRTGGRVL